MINYFEIIIDCRQSYKIILWDLEKLQLINKLKAWQPDCIVTNESDLIPEFLTFGIPILVTPAKKKLVPGVINILADDAKVGHIGAKYFIDKGFKNFAFYGTDHIFWSALRKVAFKEKVISAGFKYFELEALLNDQWQENPARIINWMKNLPKPVAIMACSDEFGIHIIEAANLGEIKIPEEIALLGVDNDEFVCNLYNPPMSSIDQEPEKVGFEVGQYIRSLIRYGLKKGKTILGTNFRVVTRRSTDFFAVDDAQIKKAMHFIQKMAIEKAITVDDVVSSTSLSRRLLEIRFRRMLNRSIHEEIKRIRIEAISNKLILTNLPINEIAYSMGFSSLTSFSVYFKKVKKITPMELRMQFKIV